MIHAFFDDSGKESQPTEPFVCMAGYLAHHSYWELFISQWSHLLLRHGISCLHMRNLIPLRDEYADLEWDVPHRDEVLKEFIGVIKRNLLIGFGVGVDAQAWRDFRKLHPELPDVQLFCFARIMRMVIDRMKIADPHDQLNVHFDLDQQFSPVRLQLYEEIRKREPDLKAFLSAITFADAKSSHPLQAADLLAWETRKSLVQRAGGYNHTSRYKDLFRTLLGVQLDYRSELWPASEINESILNPNVLGRTLNAYPEDEQ